MARCKTVEFKGEKFKPVKLLNFYAESVDYFNNGDVEVLGTGEVFDISELAIRLAEELKGIGNKDAQLIDADFDNSISKSANNIINKILTKEYENKLNNDTITLNEIEEWKSMMSYSDRNNFTKIKYDKYITINHSKGKPEGMSMNDYGRFFSLLHIMRKRDNHTKFESNGKAIKRSTLSELLDFKNERTYDNFISRLKGFGMLVKTDYKNTNDNFIIINPAYAMRFSKIDVTTYMYFKEDLDELLTPLEIKYLELQGENGYSDHILKVTTG